MTAGRTNHELHEPHETRGRSFVPFVEFVVREASA
jgi:hypothetical protein